VINLSSLSVTPITGASVVIINNYCTEYTSGIRITRINGTWVEIIALNLIKDGS
jgi:hypothetical protein